MIPRRALTCVTHELPRNFLVTAATAEDLATQSAMVAATKSSELFIAVITFFTLAVWHPVLLQVTVLKTSDHRSQIEALKKTDRLIDGLMST